MASEPDFVSIVLPTFNRSKMLPCSIRSILVQTHRNFELIVVDDGSTDGTETVLAAINDPRVRRLTHECNRGQSAARNSGIAVCTADLIAFQDSDDAWMPEKLSRQLAILRENPELAGVYCDLRWHDRDGKRFVIRAPDLVVGRFFDDRPTLFQTYGLGIQTCLLRKKLLVEKGGFRENMRCFEDLELLLWIAHRYRLQRIPEALVEYFDTADSVSKNLEAEEKARVMLRRRYGMWAISKRFVPNSSHTTGTQNGKNGVDGSIRPWEPRNRNGGTWAEWLSLDPIIIHQFPSVGFPFGAAGTVGPLLRDRPVHYLVGLAWTAEPRDRGTYIVNAARAYLSDHPLHDLTFLANTPEEARILSGYGFSAVTLNQNLLINDEVFRPVKDVQPIYDAVYNARLSPEKRHELAADLESVAFIYFYNSYEGPPEAFHSAHVRLRELMPRATFFNKLTPEGCEWMLPHQVNQVLAQSHVGLCLSPAEGAMRASIEYLFAGLPIVSTPSLGGRDIYFDDEFCRIAEPNPAAIRNAVKDLIARKIDRDNVRRRTLQKIEADRQRYISLAQALVDRAGGKQDVAARFWACTRSSGLMRWRSMSEFSETLLTELRLEHRTPVIPFQHSRGPNEPNILKRSARPWEPDNRNESTWVEWLSLDPIIIHQFPSVGFPFGAAGTIGPLLRERPVHYLVGLAWTAETATADSWWVEAARAYLSDHPLHDLTFLANTPKEAQILSGLGFPAVALNHNLLVNEQLYHPLKNENPVYDAVYNARLSPEKRHELAADLESVAFMYYKGDSSPEELHPAHARLRELLPRATFFNKLTPEGCEWMLPHQVNQVLAQSRVGLCLSPAEGAMRASIEYLFAGLPIVSTPSLGGRDIYFDDEFCRIAEPNPAAIRNAVQDLVARKIDRDHVRRRTLQKVEADRQRYISLAQALVDRAGGKQDVAARFWACTRSSNLMRWRSMSEFSETLLTELRLRSRG